MTLARARNGRPRSRGDGLRRCVGCGLAREPKYLIRLHAPSRGRSLVDLRGVGGGRGTYLCYDQRCLEAAFKKQRLLRALKIAGVALSQQEVQVDVIHQLEAAAQHEFHLAWNQGAVMVRPAAITAALAAGTIRMLLVAEPLVEEDGTWSNFLDRAGAIPSFPIEPVVPVVRDMVSWRRRLAIHRRAATARLEQVFRHLEAMGRFD